MMAKLAAIYQLSRYFNLAIYRLISSKFHIWITFFNFSHMFEYEFCLMNENHDDHQSGYTLFTARHVALCLSLSVLVNTFLIV